MQILPTTHELKFLGLIFFKGDLMIESAVLIKIGLIISALVAFAGAKYYFRAPDDSFVEEYAEEIIKEQTGFDIDLTPFSEESPLIMEKRRSIL